jgi:nucleoside-diphosphate-sugar epimerase
MKRILVTGAGGYLGIPLCRELLRRGYHVVALDRYYFGQDKFGELSKNKNLRILVDDIRSFDVNVLKDVDGIIDLAGLSNDLTSDIDLSLTQSINLDGGARVANGAKKMGVRRYIYSSSASVYGQGLKTHLIETDECRPQTLYAKSKLYVERHLNELADSKFEPVVFRNATIFGLSPRMRFDLAINIMTLRAWKERVIYIMGGGEQWRPFIHLNDVVDVFVRGLEAEAEIVAGQTFNVGDVSMNYQIRQLAQFILDVIPNVDVHHIPDDPDKRTYNLSFDKIKQKLGFEAKTKVHEGVVEIKQALERGAVNGDDPTCYTLQWYKSLIEWQQRINGLSIDGNLI